MEHQKIFIYWMKQIMIHLWQENGRCYMIIQKQINDAVNEVSNDTEVSKSNLCD